jgi:beta-phosphoglucomutase-like phosphatase (HAD superfamily)
MAAARDDVRDNRRLTGFIFDFDGVLVDSNSLHVEAWRRALEKHGHHLAPEAIFPEIGKGGDKLVVSLLGQDVEDRQGNSLRDAHGSEYPALVQARGLRGFSGGQRLIAALRERGLATALATSSEGAEIELAERATGVPWRTLFDKVIGADDVDETKPAPDLVSVAVKKLALAASDCAMLGDTPWDIEATRHAGANPLAVTSGGHRAETLWTAGACAVYRDAADVLDHLDDVLGRHWPAR